MDFTSPMHMLAASGDVNGFEKLFKKGKLNLEEKSGGNAQTPLHAACYAGNFDMAYYLVSKGASIHSKDAQGWTPLHCAAIQDHLKICSLLLTRGADPNAMNVQMTSPLHYIIRSPYREELLEVLDLMIEHGVNLEIQNKYQETPLLQSALKGLTESVRFLLDHNVYVNSANVFQQTALHLAVENGNKDTILLLLKCSADINLPSKSGTSLEIAIREGKQEIVNLLKDNDWSGQSTYTAFQSKGDSTPAPFARTENTKFIAKITTEQSSSDILVQSDESKDEVNTLTNSNSLQVPELNIGTGGTVRKSFTLRSPRSTSPTPSPSPSPSSSLTATNPIIGSYFGFKRELGKTDANREYSLDINPCNYKNWFYHSEHVNFVGKMNRRGTFEKFEPICVSILTELSNMRYRIIVWSRLGDKQLFFPISTSSTNVGIMSHFNSKTPKWKNGLPSEIKQLIKQHVLENRPKDKDVEMEFEYVNESEQKFKDQLLEFETDDPLRAKCFSVGVLYSREGQKEEEELFGNEHGSEAFNQFLEFLGDKIPLKGWLGYRGDLDTKTDAAGKFSVFRRWKGYEIMFHVSTLLPYTPDNDQQLARKRRIGNDIGVIVFQEGGVYTPPIRSQFLHAYYVVSPVPDENENSETQQYLFQVSSQDLVPEFKPEIPNPPIVNADRVGLNFLLTKVINGLQASLRHPALREKIWCKPKETFLVGLVKSHAKKSIASVLKEPEMF